MTAPEINRDFTNIAGDGFDIVTALAAQNAKAQDLEDYHHGISGIEGRNRHTRNGGAKSEEAERKRRERVTEQLTALAQKLKDDPDYAALYYATEDLLTRAETLIERALKKAYKDLTKAEETLQTVMDNAAQLPDGRRVFIDEDGSFWDAQDSRIPDEDAASIVWRDGNSTRSDVKGAQSAVTGERETIGRLEHYQVDVLGNARVNIDDEENLMSEDELDNIHKNIIDLAEPSIRDELVPASQDSVAAPDIIPPEKPLIP